MTDETSDDVLIYNDKMKNLELKLKSEIYQIEQLRLIQSKTLKFEIEEKDQEMEKLTQQLDSLKSQLEQANDILEKLAFFINYLISNLDTKMK